MEKDPPCGCFFCPSTSDLFTYGHMKDGKTIGWMFVCKGCIWRMEQVAFKIVTFPTHFPKLPDKKPL